MGLTPRMVEKPISRRYALGLVALAYASLWQARFASATKRSQDVLIIGAGIAGLSAAQALRSRGISCTILEASSRVGGRIYTDRSFGYPVDLGAAWIHQSEGNPIAELGRKEQIATVVDADTWRHYKPTGALTSKASKGADRVSATLEREVWKQAKSLEEDISYKEAMEHVLRARNASEEEKLFAQFFLSRLALSFGVSAEHFSLRYGSNMGALGGSDLAIPSGFDMLLPPLYEGLDIRLHEQVQSVEQQGDVIHIQTSQGTFKANAVIVTSSLGVLKSNAIRFAPELPDWKQAAIKRLGFGLLNKIVMEFPRVFWPKETSKFGFISPEADYFPEVVNGYPLTKQPLLIGLLGGDKAAAVEKLSDEQTVSQQMHVLRQMFGARIPDPTRHLVTRWKQAPHILGAYSHIPLGATDADHEYLAYPVGRIFFAGEATNRQFPGTVHGAFLSGIRAAKEVTQSFPVTKGSL